MIQALNEGASRIVVSEVFLTISNHTAEGKELIEELNVEENLAFRWSTPARCTIPRPCRACSSRELTRNIGDTPKSKVAMLLVGHGQPDEWDVEWATETEQEIGFRRPCWSGWNKTAIAPRT